eukprot:TRINITY_DN26876_c0_g1_i1.p1 TRINITY_DN26876_c0_g1~~TRINITY_DN26876_c0_g1_i1.p1  ORF type:complete len:327 (-),score=60.62 TRINITY_DN26876_c0_g1_i1:36-1016(-)
MKPIFSEAAVLLQRFSLPPAGNVLFLAIASASAGGALHGVSMAMRKHFGAGHERYWLQWRWWIGVLSDGVAGCLIWPTMPFVSVEVLVPLVHVIQLCTSHVIGLLFFGEIAKLRKSLGVVCALAGMLAISLSTSAEAANFSIGEFWAAWLHPRFLLSAGIAALVLVAAFAKAPRPTAWALSGAVLEGVQYICSRSLIDTAMEDQVFRNGAVLAAACVKGLCIVFILHFQQQGLQADFSSFAGTYLVASMVAMCAFGAAFFGDRVEARLAFASSFLFTLVGIWLLHDNEETGPSGEQVVTDAEQSVESEAASAKDAKEVHEANPQDS